MIYVRYIENYYSILHELRTKHPQVEIESCSGGGGRVDLGVMRYTDEVWTSDNTDPFDRLSIQDGFSYAYTPQVMMAWVTDSPNWYNHRMTSLTYRFLSAMQGSLGIGADLNKWTPQDFATAKQMIAEYKADARCGAAGNVAPPCVAAGRQQLHRDRIGFLGRAQGSGVCISAFPADEISIPCPPPAGTSARHVVQHPRAQRNSPERYPSASLRCVWMHQGISLALTGDFSAQAVLLTAEPH